MLYVIAEHRVRVSFLDDYQDASMLSSFVSFQTDDDGSDVYWISPWMTLYVL